MIPQINKEELYLVAFGGKVTKSTLGPFLTA